MNTKTWKRILAGLLAGILIFTGVPFSSVADEPPVQMIIRGDAFQNRQINIFGHSHRSITCYYVNPVEGHVPAFCLQPGKKLPNHTQATWQRYTASPETSIPVIGSFDRYLPMMMAYEWMVSGNYYDKTRYAVVQTYFWGCLAGYEREWDVQEETMKKLEWAIGDGRVLSLFHEMQRAVENDLEEYESGSGSSLPAWNGRRQNLVLKDGHYELTLDISSCPKLKDANWQFPDKNWSFTQGPGENEITFLYTGEEPSGRISAGSIEGLEERYYAYIFQPAETFQMQMGWLDMQKPEAEVWFETGKSGAVGGQMAPLERFRHREVFEADYKIGLEKYCAETGQPLAGADFNVWESFDHSQINERGYEEGEPDGVTGEVYANCMSPEPEEEWLCDVITTDEEGKAFHRDIRNYNYSKTYCMGHPAPEWIECDHEGGGAGEEGDGEEEECSCEEENERLREQWMAEQELCEAASDFHVPNDDEEDHEQSTQAMEEMLEDRDETYENFISLEYGYTLTEKKARNGYMVHGTHSEDFEIESIVVASAQAQREALQEDKIPADEKTGKQFTVPGNLNYGGQLEKAGISPGYSYVYGAENEKEIDERRQVTQLKVAEDIYDEYEEDEDEEDEWWDETEEIWEKQATKNNAGAGFRATPSNGGKDREITEQYIYSREETQLSPLSSFEPVEKTDEKISLFREDEEDGDEMITAFLPEFQDDDLGDMDVSGFGDPDTFLYQFRIWNHRTEGKIYINKRDMQLYEADAEESYGKTQGDGTLEGAVYGLFAAADILHPDGKSGVIYRKDDLTAIAATDQEGNAAFLAYTEAPHTLLNEDGTMGTPEGFHTPKNLYNGSTIDSSKWGFGSYTYPDRETENGNAWVGRPLLMGSYYIRELSRSEGYELSVAGKNLTETNRLGTEENTVRKAGQVRISQGLSDHNSMEADGSWNDFTVEAFGTENGYEITVSGYPEQTKFYKLRPSARTETLKQITGMEKIPKTDVWGNPVYKKAAGGELKKDKDGNPILKLDPKEDEKVPASETVAYHFRTAPYIKGEAEPEDLSLWDEALEPDYLTKQVLGMLKQLGYRKITEQGTPWAYIQIDPVNGKAAEQILDWYTEHGFYDMADVEEIIESEGNWYAKLLYDHSDKIPCGTGIYDRAEGKLYVKKERKNGHYWVDISKDKFRLGSHTAYVKEKREYMEAENTEAENTEAVDLQDERISLEDRICVVWEPVYERYEKDEILSDAEGNPIVEMEQVPVFEERTTSYVTTEKEPLVSVWDPVKKEHRIQVDNTIDWSGRTEAEEENFRAETKEKTIRISGEEVPYNQYLTSLGACVDVKTQWKENDPGSFIQYIHLAYPGQNQAVQDGGTKEKPVILLERVIRQPVRVTKHISQSSYENVNTYGSIHNDPLTSFLGLFGKNGQIEGRKILDQFSFRIYLKRDLLNVYGGNEGEKKRLLEEKEDGSLNYRKFFDAMEGAERKKKDSYPDEVLTQFALDHYDIKAYKEEVLKNWPYMDSDRAYEQALKQAKEETAVYLDQFTGLKEGLSVEWERDEKGGTDGNRKTIQCNRRNGKESYYEYSIPLPYGEYVIAEQIPKELPKELANRHYKTEEPREIFIPFVPEIIKDENTGEEIVLDETGSAYFRYKSSDSPDDLIRKYKIRFNEEDRKIQTDNIEGSFEIYPYGLDKDIKPGPVLGTISQSEDKAVLDGVLYDGNETENGQIQVRDHVPAMKGQNMAVEGKFAPMLVPWSVLTPETDRINPDTGNVETLKPGGIGAAFNYVAFKQEDFENTYFHSRLRIEKVDSETGENIIHDGALFRIYAAKRDVKKTGTNSILGTGQVMFGPAVDHEGNRVLDTEGKEILYPRVGMDNAAENDLPVQLDEDGIPLYDERQRISQVDEKGTERGIFRSFTTLREVLIDGKLEKIPVGYIETPQPLGAGTYVLVEVQAPEGYVKSRPVAFEIYGDQVSYYQEKIQRDGTMDGYERKTAARYEYAIPVTGDGNKTSYETVSQIPVNDHPSKMQIRKVEDGDSYVGNENGLLETDLQGIKEDSGGLNEKILVNDAGDTIVYQVYGRKEKLEERGDVRDIHFDTEKGTWTGNVTKKMDQYSEEIIEGTEKELKAMEGVKLLYDRQGRFTGKGIRFKVTVSGAALALYQGLIVEKDENGGYKGVKVEKEDAKTVKITASETGSRRKILEKGKEDGSAALSIWEDEKVKNEPKDLYFYDLEQLRSEERLEPANDENIYKVLDERGNFICYADGESGMAFVLDDYGRIVAYVSGEDGQKQLVYSVKVHKNENGESIYTEKRSADDENGLPVYDKNGHLTMKEEQWISDGSTNSKGEKEETGGLHEIDRLAFGAYILQEEQVPFEQGYVQSPYQGIFFKDTIEPQEFFHSNAFTRAAFAKIDVRTQKEIKGAVMTLYEAKKDDEGNLLTDEDNIYLPGKVYASWISGYSYDDAGNLMVDETGEKIETDEPHWIDHIPVGEYVLEETECPYEQGYVQKKRENVRILETENVQSFTMEDDFTAVEIRKEDGKTGELLYEDSLAELTLYQILEEGKDPIELVTFDRAGFKEWQEMWATGREETDAAGLNPITKYDYQWKEVSGTRNGRYCCTENGSIRFEYLPVGFYILKESSTPSGYATADPISFEITDTGHLEMIHQVVMEDEPLRLQVSKNTITGGKEVAGARLGIYPADENGSISETPLALHIPEEEGRYRDEEAVWISGLDGTYTQEEKEKGEIPEGFVVGDLKPHLIEYIPAGSYILREETTPYGFLQSVDIPFTVEDTKEIQKIEMQDEIPEGRLEVVKHDSEHKETLLQGAEFELFNKTLGISCEKQETNEQGKAVFCLQPMGYLDKNGNFSPYDYLIRETKAAPGYMLSEKTLEFQFEYKDEKTAVIEFTYDPVNDSNRVQTKKLLGDTSEYLEGAVLRLEREETTIKEGENGELKSEITWTKAETWTTGKQPHLVKGLKAGKYRLVEISAPAGFTKTDEIVCFTITDGMTEIPEVILRNYGTIIYVEKQDDSLKTLLPGAKLELVRKDTMEVIRQWVSEDEKGQTFYGLEPGSYILRELEAPAGYEKKQEMEIQILNQTQEPQKFIFYNSRIRSVGGGGNHTVPKKTYISFKKTDEEGNPLAGAVFAFYNQLGQVMEMAESGENGYFKIPVVPDGTYVFREITAPEGYEVSSEIYHVTIENGERVKGIFEIKNEKIQEKKKGRIQAFYERKVRNTVFHGNYEQISGHSLKTGDASRIVEVSVMTLLCMLLACWCFFKGTNGREKRKKLIWFMGILTGMVLMAGFCASAQEMQKEEPLYVWEEIIYQDTEDAEEIPQTAWITVKDPENGKKMKRLMPLQTVSYLNEHQKASEDGKNVVDCKAVYGGLAARENAKALSDLNSETFKEEYAMDLDTPEVRNERQVICLAVLAVSGITVLIWIWKKRCIGKIFLLIRKKQRIIGVFFAAAAFLGAVYMGRSLKNYRTAAESYEIIRKEAEIISQDTEHSGMEIDEEKLKKINPDYSFWIRILGTAVDYPVVWSKEEECYLDHGFDGKEQIGGAIFADSGRIPFVSANTIVYGHNMKDGSMFGDLKKYKDPKFAGEHPYIEIYRHGKWISCPVIASKIIEENEATPYQNGTEKILTLSTCYGKTKRMVVQARITE